MRVVEEHGTKKEEPEKNQKEIVFFLHNSHTFFSK